MADEGSGPNGRPSEVATRDGHTPRREPRIAEIFDGRYRIEELLGEGGFARVYRARDVELDETVALKRLLNVTAVSAEMLRREVRLARRVTHPNVVRVHDLGVSADGVVYLTMEYVGGASLRDVLRRGPADPDEAAAFVREICEGLDAAHRAGVVHADLKPANVLVREADGRRTALLTDFGIARALSETQSMLLGAGTPQYMAPEQRGPGSVDARADIYALGLLVFELFAGERLLGPGIELDARALEARVRAKLPEALAGVIVRALDPHPDRRPATAHEIAHALGEGGPRTHTRRAAPFDSQTRLAVAPFRVVGTADEEYLGIGLAEELARLFSSTSGLAVLGTGALAADRDGPREAARKLGARAIVEGTVQRVGGRVRVNVGLVEVSTGVQLWGDRLDAAMEDALAFEEELAMRICEALRIRFIAVDGVRSAKPEAVELYFRARDQLFRGAVAGASGAVALLERCIELAPELAPALALHAIACGKAWFLPSASHERDWAEVSRTAAARAVAQAPLLAESHVAAGLSAMQDGDIVESARAFHRALDLAPTSATAHDYLGRFQVEVGRTTEGFAHLDVAGRLDPTLEGPPIYRARHHAFRGDRSHMQPLRARTGYAFFPALHLLVRVAAWFGDDVELRRCLASARDSPVLREEVALVESYCRYVLGEVDTDEVERAFEQIPLARLSVRIRSNLHQTMAEGHALRGARELALRHIEAAAGLALIDLDWLARCPALGPVRDTDAFRRAEQATRTRAEALLG